MSLPLLALAQLLVVCDPGDPLRPVAEEIARTEQAPLAPAWSGARGEFLVWVVSPSRLSDAVILDFARAWKRQFPTTAVGLISGWTPESALVLWRRGRSASGARAAAFVAAEDAGKQAFLTALQSNGYVTFAGHGGQTYLAAEYRNSVRAADVPPVPDLVLGTSSCNVFRPWTEGSIAMAFVEQGAAAFTGSVYSPESGYLTGSRRGLPLRHTYPEFPVGRVVQLQNRSAQQSYAALPFYFMLGDPRMALSRERPYIVAADEVYGETRAVTLSGAPAGFVPVRIAGGAAYTRVEASGASAARSYGFYNSRLQMMDAGADKFVLAAHAGGPLTIVLKRDTPWWWLIGRFAADALDNTLVFLLVNAEGGIIFVAIGVLACLLAVRRHNWAGALAAACVLAALHALYVWLRLPHAVITSKPLEWHSQAFAGTFLTAAGGAALYLSGRRKLALLVALCPVWLPALLHLGMTLGANIVFFRPQLGVDIYAYKMAILAWAATLLLLPVVWAVLSAAAARHGRVYSRSAPTPTPPAA